MIEWKIEFIDLGGIGHWIENIQTEELAYDLRDALYPYSMMIDIYKREVVEWTRLY
jgi:hypothetical protein